MMSMFASLCILGRQPAIGMAELESLYGANAVQPVGEVAALLDIPTSEVPFTFLGGTVKFCKVLIELDTTKWHDIQKFLEQAVPEHAARLPEGKMKLGLSVYGLNTKPKQIVATALGLKKIIQTSGRSVRVVPNTEPALNSAQVLHNQLTGQLGWELIFVRNGSKTIVAQSIAVQDITAYTKRDQKRPKRDARVGMLPPKLAQIIINLASGQAPKPECGPGKLNGLILLDPFCGTGVILQEAILMGYEVKGTDLEDRMIEYSQANLDWLSDSYNLSPNNYALESADATSNKWSKEFNLVATEAYLGRPFTSQPSLEIVNKTIAEVNTITIKFLKNLASQTKSGFRACIALPAWPQTTQRISLLPSKARNSADTFGTNSHFSSPPLSRSSTSTASSGAQGKNVSGTQMRDLGKENFLHLPLLDNLKELGYTRVSFVHASDRDLIYHRPGQFVGRELVVLRRT